MAKISTEPNSRDIVIAVDQGGTKCSAAAIAPETGDLVTERVTLLHNGDDFVWIMRSAIDHVKRAIPQDRTVRGIGIACAGLIDSDAGVIVNSINLRVKDYPLAQIIKELSGGMPCFVANDLHCATLGELHFGAGRGFKDVLMVSLGTGIGARQVSNGMIVSGKRGFAGEFGQMLETRLPPGSLQVRQDTLEHFCSHLGISNLIIERLGREELKALSYEDIQSLAGKPEWDYDHTAVKLAVEEAAGIMAVNLANLALFTDPARIILGGGAIGLIPKYFEQICQHTLANPMIADSGLEIVRAELGDNAGLVGAAMLLASA
jgi:glucokinase